MADTITLYQLVTPWGAKEIQNTQRINKASKLDRYGEGVYFSEYPVDLGQLYNVTTEQKARWNDGMTDDALKKQAFIDHVVTVTLRRDVVKPADTFPDPGIWIYKTDTHLDLKSVIDWDVSAVPE